ncbi:Protein of unknown function [Gryllus bimaculatus]|nr:Protein of unknown function [Gryllus bimaculatus]
MQILRGGDNRRRHACGRCSAVYRQRHFGRHYGTLQAFSPQRLKFVRKNLAHRTCLAACVLERLGVMRDGRWTTVPAEKRLQVYHKAFADDVMRLEAADAVINLCHERGFSVSGSLAPGLIVSGVVEVRSFRKQWLHVARKLTRSSKETKEMRVIGLRRHRMLWRHT